MAIPVTRECEKVDYGFANLRKRCVHVEPGCKSYGVCMLESMGLG